jgi:hypothetical protein
MNNARRNVAASDSPGVFIDLQACCPLSFSSQSSRPCVVCARLTLSYAVICVSAKAWCRDWALMNGYDSGWQGLHWWHCTDEDGWHPVWEAVRAGRVGSCEAVPHRLRRQHCRIVRLPCRRRHRRRCPLLPALSFFGRVRATPPLLSASLWIGYYNVGLGLSIIIISLYYKIFTSTEKQKNRYNPGKLFAWRLQLGRKWNLPAISLDRKVVISEK